MKEMNKKELEISKTEDIEKIIKSGSYMTLALKWGDFPYAVPVCYGYDEGAKRLYFHSSKRGLKSECISKEPKASFSIVVDAKLYKGENACNYDFSYKSVTGFGNIQRCEGKEKEQGFNVLMSQYADGSFEYNEKAVKAADVLYLEIEEMKGKSSDGSTFS